MASASTVLVLPLLSLVGAFSAFSAFCTASAAVAVADVGADAVADVVAAAALPADESPSAAGSLAVDLVPLLVVTLSFSRVRSVQCHTTR
jgi:hypothetical protein